MGSKAAGVLGIVKVKPIRSKKLRESARGQQCTLEIIGICNRNTETTVLAHLPDESKGAGRKSDDFVSCFACAACHDFIDGRNPFGKHMDAHDKEWHMRRAQNRTMRAWIEQGVVKI